MSAPTGNEFWKLRSKSGRDVLFSDPESLWEAACEYFEWCEANPLISVEIYGKDAIECKVPKVRAFTWQALCMYLDCNVQYFTDFEESKTCKENKDFSIVCTRIRETIYNQKYINAAAGFLNANLISRDLGLKEQTENKTDHTGELIIKGQKFANKD